MQMKMISLSKSSKLNKANDETETQTAIFEFKADGKPYSIKMIIEGDLHYTNGVLSTLGVIQCGHIIEVEFAKNKQTVLTGEQK